MMKRIESLRVKLAKGKKKRLSAHKTQLVGPVALAADNESVFAPPNVTYSY